MSRWTTIVFDPGDRDPDAVEADLLESIRSGTDDICRNPDDPRTWQESDGRVGWYVREFAYEETIAQLSVPCRRALAIDVNDTTEAAAGYLYEWVDGAFLEVDSFADDEYGRTCLDYFALEYGIQGERRV